MLLLMDKGYYDYDFTQPPKPEGPLKQRSKKEMSSMLARFGFKTKLRDTEKKKPITPEELQQRVWEEEQKS